MLVASLFFRPDSISTSCIRIFSEAAREIELDGIHHYVKSSPRIVRPYGEDIRDVITFWYDGLFFDRLSFSIIELFLRDEVARFSIEKRLQVPWRYHCIKIFRF